MVCQSERASRPVSCFCVCAVPHVTYTEAGELWTGGCSRAHACRHPRVGCFTCSCVARAPFMHVRLCVCVRVCACLIIRSVNTAQAARVSAAVTPEYAYPARTTRAREGWIPPRVDRCVFQSQSSCSLRERFEIAHAQPCSSKLRCVLHSGVATKPQASCADEAWDGEMKLGQIA